MKLEKRNITQNNTRGTFSELSPYNETEENIDKAGEVMTRALEKIMPSVVETLKKYLMGPSNIREQAMKATRQEEMEHLMTFLEERLNLKTLPQSEILKQYNCYDIVTFFRLLRSEDYQTYDETNENVVELSGTANAGITSLRLHLQMQNQHKDD